MESDTASSDQGPDRVTGKLSTPIITRYAYDKAGRLVRRDVPAVVQDREMIFPEQTHHFAFDKAGRLVEARCDKTSVQFKRDLQGRLVEELLAHEDVNPYTAHHANSHAAGRTAQFTHCINRPDVSQALRDTAGQTCGCTACGGRLRRIGQDLSEQLEYVPSRFKVIRHVRPKLACVACEAIYLPPEPPPLDQLIACKVGTEHSALSLPPM